MRRLGLRGRLTVVVGLAAAVVLAALQITAELFDARTAMEATNESIQGLSDYVRPLLPPAKRHAAGSR